MPHRVNIAAVADPDPRRRARFAERHAIAESGRFERWEEFFREGREIDAVLVATMDRDHVGPAVAALESGYHLLLEKPMAPSLGDIRRIVDAYEAAVPRGVIAGVVHPLRYGPSFAALHDLVADGRIGKLITLDHLEGVGWWHQAHSFVRGNWKNESTSSFMLLAKSCHDIDYVCHLVGRPVVRTSSFGSLCWFRKENAPAGSTERCVDCPLEPECEYSAIRTYVTSDPDRFPVTALGVGESKEARMEAIRTGPYGRCVWRSGNDVVDHQVVMLEFDDSTTATVTMTAFSQRVARRSRLHGTVAEVEFDQDSLTIRDFASGDVSRRTFGNLVGGHAGSDAFIANGFVRALETGDQRLITTSLPESATTHLLTFAAEEARKLGTVIDVNDFAAEHGIELSWPGRRTP